MGESTMRCLTHPEREFPAHYRFCDVCGQPLVAQTVVKEQQDATTPPTAKEEMTQAVSRSCCPRCQAEVQEGTRFCQACGFLLREEPKIEPRPIQERRAVARSCRKCGMAVGPGLKFCETCGAPVKVMPKWTFWAAASLVLVIALGVAGLYGYRYYRQRQISTITQPAEEPSEVTSGPTAQGPEGDTTKESSVPTGETSTGNVTETRPSGNTPGGPTRVALTIVSTPPECEVYLDGKPQGQTDATGRLVIPDVPPGQHTIRLLREGYLEWRRDVDVRSSMSITAQLAPIPPVTLTVSTLPGSKVYLDARPVGTTDANGQLVIPNVQQGSHQVRVSREGYEDWVQTITLNSDLTLPVTLTRLPYQRRLQMARSEMNAGRINQALSLLQELISEEPTRPEAYELMGQIYYEKGDFPRARQVMRRAIQNGGHVKFSVTHDHMGGLDPVDPATRQWKVYCTGDLIITSSSLQFESSDSRDSFTVSWADIREAKVNVTVGSQIGAFHIKIKTRGGERNFNFAPRTKSRTESQMILSLLQD